MEPILEEVHGPEIPSKDIEGTMIQPIQEEGSPESIHHLDEILEITATNINSTSLDGLSEPEWEDGIIGFITDLLKECKRENWPFFGWNVTDITLNVRQTKQHKPISFKIDLQHSTPNGDLENCTYLIHVTNFSNGTSMASSLKRIKEYLTQNPEWKGILFRDENLPIDQLPASYKLVQELNPQLTINYLPRNHIAILFALKKMLKDATGGDLQLENRIISRNEVMEFIYKKVHQEEFFQNLFPGLSNIAESVPPISISQVAPITPAVPQDTKSDPAPLTSEPFDISAPPTTIFPDSAESTIIIEAIQKILKRKAIINITALVYGVTKGDGNIRTGL